MELKGLVLLIGEKESFPNGFEKRNIVLKTNEQYPQEIQIEFIKDNMKLIENLKVGDKITVGINIQGNDWVDPKTGKTRYFVSIKGWRLSVEGSQEISNEEDDLPF